MGNQGIHVLYEGSGSNPTGTLTPSGQRGKEEKLKETWRRMTEGEMAAVGKTLNEMAHPVLM